MKGAPGICVIKMIPCIDIALNQQEFPNMALIG